MENIPGYCIVNREKFVKALKNGINEGEPSLECPMMPYVDLTDHDAEAIFKYLQTIPPLKNKVERIVYE
jgi:hypothetical protein